MKMTQRAAVFAATMSVLKDGEIDFEINGDVSEVMTKELRESVHTIVCESFTTGNVEFKDTPANEEKLSNPSKLSSYVSGLISNWYRKDKRFNGNTVYKPKNPGSRAGQGDSQLKALRSLFKQYSGTDEANATKIEKAINTRLSELAVERAKQVQVDISALPSHLIEELGLSHDG